MAIGVSFVPTASGQGQQPDTAAAVSPIQKAIQFLSLRLPRVVGAGQVVPTQLLAGPAGGGVPGAAGAGDFGGGGGTGSLVPPTFSMPEAPPSAAPGVPGMAPSLQSVLAGQPGSAAAMIQAIDQATLPALQKKKTLGIGGPAAQGFPAPPAAPQPSAPAPPQPTAPQPLPTLPQATPQTGQGLGFPFGLSGRGFGA